MGECQYPDCEGDDNLSYSCNRCGQIYCSDHRLPEKHYCGIPTGSSDTDEDAGSDSDSNSSGAWIVGLVALPFILIYRAIRLLLLGPLRLLAARWYITPLLLLLAGVGVLFLPVGPDAGGFLGQTQLDDAAVNASEDLAGGDSLNDTKIEKLIHKKINDIRSERGYTTLDYDSDLHEIAEYHSQDMASNDYFAHTAPDGETMMFVEVGERQPAK